MRHATKVIRIVAVERIESMEIVEFNENKKYENEEEENGTRKQAFQCVANLKIVLPQHRKTELLRTKKNNMHEINGYFIAEVQCARKVPEKQKVSDKRH